MMRCHMVPNSSSCCAMKYAGADRVWVKMCSRRPTHTSGRWAAGEGGGVPAAVAAVREVVVVVGALVEAVAKGLMVMMAVAEEAVVAVAVVAAAAAAELLLMGEPCRGRRRERALGRRRLDSQYPCWFISRV